MHPEVDTIKREPKQQKDRQGRNHDRDDESFIVEIDFQVIMECGINKFLKSMRFQRAVDKVGTTRTGKDRRKYGGSYQRCTACTWNIIKICAAIKTSW